MISVLLTLLSLALWPHIWSVLGSVLCALAVWGRVPWGAVSSLCSRPVSDLPGGLCC